MAQPRKLKRVVIKEELVALTGHYVKALILNQMIFWSERVSDFDMFLEETRKRDSNIDVELQHGWIYKNASELSEELMIDVSAQTIRRYMLALISEGYILERQNPKNNWDRTMQYRVDLTAISRALDVLGYALEGYSKAIGTVIQNGAPNLQNGDSNLHGGGAIPKTTTKITSEMYVDPSNDSSKAKPATTSKPTHMTFASPEEPPKYKNTEHNTLTDYTAFGEDNGVDARTMKAMTDAVLGMTGDLALSKRTTPNGTRVLNEAHDTVMDLITIGIKTPEETASIFSIWNINHFTRRPGFGGTVPATPSHKMILETAKNIVSGAWSATPAKPAFKPERIQHRGLWVETINVEGDYIDPDEPSILRSRSGDYKASIATT